MDPDNHVGLPVFYRKPIPAIRIRIRDRTTQLRLRAPDVVVGIHLFSSLQNIVYP
ncbi:MAG: hypothetical protein WBA17_01920 [Saprospiraceae bacterium]